ncbi:MAG: hypothetical protein U1F58_13670 [Burkholderiales bacterium]
MAISGVRPSYPDCRGSLFAARPLDLRAPMSVIRAGASSLHKGMSSALTLL